MTMFSGLVLRGQVAFLRQFELARDCVTTGMVMRKMISSTSITSTSGVVLMVAFSLVLVAIGTGAKVHGH